MAYFTLRYLGISFERYNQENPRATSKQKNELVELQEKRKYYLLEFEPKNSYYQKLVDAIHNINSVNGKMSRKYFLGIRQTLYKEGFDETIAILRKEYFDYTKKEFSTDFANKVQRSKKIDFLKSWVLAVWELWRLNEVTQEVFETKTLFEQEKLALKFKFYNQLCEYYDQEINSYFWDELIFRIFGNSAIIDHLNYSNKPEILEGVFCFINFHFIDSKDSQDFITNLKSIIAKKGNTPKELRAKVILNDWIHRTQEILGLNDKTDNNKSFLRQNEIGKQLSKKLKIERPFPKYLNLETQPIKNQEHFAEKLKDEFTTELGKYFYFLIKSLEKRKILLIGNGNYNKLYISMKNYFNRDIGSTTSLNKAKTRFEENYNSYKQDFEKIDTRVESLINMMKK